MRWRRVLYVIGASGLAACNGLLGIKSIDPQLDSGAFTLDGTSDGLTAAPPMPDSACVPLATPQAPSVQCNRNSPFGAPVLVSSLNAVNTSDFDARLTIDERTVYFARNRSEGSGVFDPQIYVATRARFSDPFSNPRLVEGIGSQSDVVFAPSVTEDGLSLFFNVLSGPASYDIAVATRRCAAAPFLSRALVPNVNGPDQNGNPIVTPDGSALYFFSDYWGDPPTFNAGGPTRRELCVSQGQGGSFSAPSLVTALDSGEADNVAVSADQLTIAFASTRGSASGSDADIWMSQRSSTAQDWPAPAALREVNSPFSDSPTWISNDGCRLYLESDRGTSGTVDIYLATRPD